MSRRADASCARTCSIVAIRGPVSTRWADLLPVNQPTADETSSLPWAVPISRMRRGRARVDSRNTDHRHPERIESGGGDGRAVLGGMDHARQPVPVEGQVRWHGRERGEAAAGAGGGEPASLRQLTAIRNFAQLACERANDVIPGKKVLTAVIIVSEGGRELNIEKALKVRGITVQWARSIRDASVLMQSAPGGTLVVT